MDEIAARLKASLDAQSRQQQQKQELIAGMSHNLKSPLTSIRAYTEGLLDGVAKDEATRTRYLQTIYDKETELESLVNRLLAFARRPRIRSRSISPKRSGILSTAMMRKIWTFICAKCRRDVFSLTGICSRAASPTCWTTAANTARARR